MGARRIGEKARPVGTEARSKGLPREPHNEDQDCDAGALMAGGSAFAVSAYDSTLSTAVPDVGVTPTGATRKTIQSMG